MKEKDFRYANLRKIKEIGYDNKSVNEKFHCEKYNVDIPIWVCLSRQRIVAPSATPFDLHCAESRCAQGGKIGRVPAVITNEKMCTKCKKYKKLEEFKINLRGKYNRYSRCIECTRAEQKIYDEKRRKAPRQKRKIDVELASMLYESGLTLRDVAKQIGETEMVTRLRLVESGLKPRAKKSKKNEIVKMKTEGISALEISRRLGADYGNVCRIVNNTDGYRRKSTPKNASNRKCRECGKEIKNGNWMYCNHCYTRKLTLIDAVVYRAHSGDAR